VSDLPATTKPADVDVLVVGAGFSGLYLLKRLRDKGFSVKCLEAGSDVGGTWYWNRYPGARCDSDSTVYCFSEEFSEQLLAEWEWSERYPSQPEIHSYLRWVADKENLRGLIEFNQRLASARYDELNRRWEVTTQSGDTITARFFVPAVGALSHPNIPRFPGLEEFKGEWYHTARLPGDVDYTGKKVVVVGNGATAVQIVPVISKVAAEVWELVRHPYHCLPARNHPLDQDDWADIHAHHKDIWERARSNYAGFPYPDPVGPIDAFTPAERREILEDRWFLGGFALAFSTFEVFDVFAREEVNRVFLEFLHDKIRGIIKDPAVADTLTPSDPFGSKRPPLEHGYYASFNRGNVHVVDLKREPIKRITERSVETSDHTIEADIILLATGFDAWSGAMVAMDVRGRGGVTLGQAWANGPEDYLGMAVAGFPNMLMQYCGPYNPAALINAPVLIEQQGQWIVDMLAWAREKGIEEFDVKPEAQAQFLQMHDQIASLTLISKTASWWTGANVEGKPRRVLTWCGGFPSYKALCDQCALGGYQEFTFRTAVAA
jgi:cation diffusion facilitator CzcD-associated flavoprotein CzcO